MTTFGTAVGDTIAITAHLGYLWSGVMFAVVIAVPPLHPALVHNPTRTGRTRQIRPVPGVLPTFTALQSLKA